MSQRLINRSPDLKRLRDEGYGVRVRSQKYLLVHPVPHVNSKKEIADGTLVCELTFNGNDVTKPGDHVIHFIGAYPCDSNGNEIKQIFNASQLRELTKDVVVDHTFSAKPRGAGFQDYYEKITAYVAMISGPAEVLDPKVTARTFPIIEATEEESVFRYVDTASSRAEIDAITNKLEHGKIGIVGLGGTGSYVLDFVAKTPVKEIHLFDGDVLSQHNAFRCPGAASIEELQGHPQKAAYWREKYDRMHRHVIAHDYYIDAANVDQLADMDFVFLCLDKGQPKKMIIDRLEQWGKSFIDVGMGINVSNGSLMGLVRVTASTPEKHDHVQNRVPVGGDGTPNEYSRNIQVADLNALNAALAVIRWKKLWGYYSDQEREHFSLYSVAGNSLINEDPAP